MEVVVVRSARDIAHLQISNYSIDNIFINQMLTSVFNGDTLCLKGTL